MRRNYRDSLIEGALARLGRYAFGTMEQRMFLIGRLAEILCAANLDKIGG